MKENKTVKSKSMPSFILYIKKLIEKLDYFTDIPVIKQIKMLIIYLVSGIYHFLKSIFDFMFKKSKVRSRLGNIALLLFLIIVGFLSAWPLLFIINNAFKPFDEIFMFPPKLFVQNPTLQNFRDLSSALNTSWVPFSRYLFNTLFITVLGTVGHVIIASMCAYPLAKYKFKGKNVIFSIIVLSLMFSSEVTDIPNFIIISGLGLTDTYLSILLPAFQFSLGLYLMKQFMEQVPIALIEAAKIDGASHFQIFWKIVMPIVKPAWLTLGILVFQKLWGLVGENFIYVESLKTLNYALSQIVTGGVYRTGVSAAISLIMIIVPVAVFVICQSSVMETMATSGIKE